MIYLGSGITVPSDFVGIHAKRWPDGSPLSAAPTYAYGAIRSHDYTPTGGSHGVGGVRWSDVNTSAGVYSWAYLDDWVGLHYTAGRSIVYNLYQCPTWAAAITGTNDPFGYNGGASYPLAVGGDGLYTDLKNYVTALVTRYNTGGTKKIKYLEIWNEPDFTTGVNVSAYWWGSASQMARLAKTVYTAAKAVDPDIIIIGTGSVDELPNRWTCSIDQFLNASDGASGYGRNWVDAFSIHYYDTFPTRQLARDITEFVAITRTLMRFGGAADLPLYTSESGWQATAVGNAWFMNLTDAQKGKTIQRNLAIQAALGIKQVCLYTHDDIYMGNPSASATVSTAIGEIHALLAGKTITYCSRAYDGTVTLRYSSGETVTI